MRWLVVALALLCALSATARAEEVSFRWEWDPPTGLVDGSVPEDWPAGVDYILKLCQGEISESGDCVEPGSPSTVMGVMGDTMTPEGILRSRPWITPTERTGQICARVRATYHQKAGPWSNMQCGDFDLTPSEPGAPQNLVVIDVQIRVRVN